MPLKPISQSHLSSVAVVGARVVLRLRLPETEVAAGCPHHTDVIGEVRSIDEASVVIATRRGEVAVPRDRVVLAKQVPPAPTRKRRRPPVDTDRTGIDDLQLLMTAGMPPLDSEHVGDWQLRAAEGYTGRANSALAVGDPGMPLSTAIDHVSAWYAERDQPALVQLPHPSGQDPSASTLGSLLVARDWRFFMRTLVMTKPTSSVAGSGRVRIDVSAAPTDDWWLTASPRSLEHRDTLARVLARIPEAAYLTAYVGDAAVGHVRLAFTDGWSGVFDLHTDPSARRQGVGSALLDAADAAAAQRRITFQYLQVDASNKEAAGLYESLGWRVHHEYHYSTPDV